MHHILQSVAYIVARTLILLAVAFGTSEVTDIAMSAILPRPTTLEDSFGQFFFLLGVVAIAVSFAVFRTRRLGGSTFGPRERCAHIVLSTLVAMILFLRVTMGG